MFTYGGAKDDECIELAFAKTQVDGRKEWLTKFMNVSVP